METTCNHKLRHLNTYKKASQARFTKAKNALNELVNNQVEAWMSNTIIRFAIMKVTLEFDIIENMIKQLKAIVAVEDMQGSRKILNVFEFIENLDKETSEITTQVQQSVAMAERQLLEHIEDSEQETMTHILSWAVTVAHNCHGKI